LPDVVEYYVAFANLGVAVFLSLGELEPVGDDLDGWEVLADRLEGVANVAGI
jgi:hypothetical protein